MIDPKLIVYGDEIRNCTRAHKIFNCNFDCYNISRKENLIDAIEQNLADVCILCSCHSKKEDIDKLSYINEIVAPLPVVICINDANPEFIVEGVKRGLMNFIMCNKSKDEIRNKLLRIVESDGIRQLLRNYLNSNKYSPYTNSILTEIIHSLPDQLQLSDLADRVGVSDRWLQVVFKKIFSLTFTQLKHKIIVYQALNLMKYSQLDNIEIAIKVGYSDENSMSRLFRKELGHSPTNIRRKITETTPEKILNSVQE